MRWWRTDSTKPQVHSGDTSSAHGSLLKSLACSSSSIGPVAKSSFCFSFQEGTWPGAEGAIMNGYGRGKEKKGCVCVVGHIGGCNYEVHIQPLLWWRVLMQVKKFLLDNLAQGLGFRGERQEQDVPECPAWACFLCQGTWELHYILRQWQTILSPSENLTSHMQKKI